MRKLEDITSVLKSSRSLTPGETYFWSYYLGVPKDEILCLKKDSLKTPKTFWQY